MNSSHFFAFVSPGFGEKSQACRAMLCLVIVAKLRLGNSHFRGVFFFFFFPHSAHLFPLNGVSACTASRSAERAGKSADSRQGFRSLEGDQLSGGQESAGRWPQCNTDAVPGSPGSLLSTGFVQSSADCQAGPCPAIITPSMGPHAHRQTRRESCRACLSVQWSVFAVRAPLLSCFTAPRPTRK